MDGGCPAWAAWRDGWSLPVRQGPKPREGPGRWQPPRVMLNGPKSPGAVVPTQVAQECHSWGWRPCCRTQLGLALAWAERPVEPGRPLPGCFLLAGRERAAQLPSQGRWGSCEG